MRRNPCRPGTPRERSALLVAIEDDDMIALQAALLDLANPKMNAMVVSGLARSVAVMLRAQRTPAGLLLAG